MEFAIAGEQTLTIDATYTDGSRDHYTVTARDTAPLSSILRMRGKGALRIHAPPRFIAPLRREGDDYVGTADDLGAPYVLGVPRKVSRLDVVMLPGERASNDGEIAAWLEKSLHAVDSYYARPAFDPLLVIVGSWRRATIFGLADHHALGSVALHFGPLSRVDGEDDWVATHEFLHFAYPFVGRQHAWFSEGMATYVEPIARVRVGELDERTMWRDLARGLPKGQPQQGDEGLEATRTWGRTYWGGALFYFTCDLELRIRTNNRLGLEHALRALHPASAPIEDVLRDADKATNSSVFHDLYDRYALRSTPVDLADTFKRLGVIINGDSVTFDNSAELAKVRAAITRRVE